MTSEQLAAIAGVFLSLLFSYAPGLREKFAALEPTRKRGIMAAMLLLVAGSAFGLSCAGVIGSFACTQQGIVGLATTYVAALVANQGAFLISPSIDKKAAS